MDVPSINDVWWPLFALAQRGLGDGINEVLVAKASGSEKVLVTTLGIVRIAVSRNARSI